jgi:hypothetical protein
VNALSEAIPILMSFDRCVGYIRLWTERKLSDEACLEALVNEIATTNGALNKQLTETPEPAPGRREG